MKKIFLLLFYVLFVMNAYSSKLKYSINEAWKFALTDSSTAYATNFNDTSWEVVSLPHTWNAQDATDEIPGYFRGQGWYRKNLYIDNIAKDKIVYLYFEGANQVTEVYINGSYVGIHKGGYTRFCFDITSFIQRDAENLISIKVDNNHNEQIPPLSADFTFFGGIYRDVYLQIENQVHFSLSDKASDGLYITTPKVSQEKAEIETKTLINNYSKENKKVQIEYNILSPEGNLVTKTTEKITLEGGTENHIKSKRFQIKSPSLWSIQSPNRYTLRTISKNR